MPGREKKYTEKIMVRLEPEQRERLENEAKKQQRSVADLARYLITSGLANSHGEATP